MPAAAGRTWPAARPLVGVRPEKVRLVTDPAADVPAGAERRSVAAWCTDASFTGVTRSTSSRCPGARSSPSSHRTPARRGRRPARRSRWPGTRAHTFALGGDADAQAGLRVDERVGRRRGADGPSFRTVAPSCEPPRRGTPAVPAPTAAHRLPAAAARPGGSASSSSSDRHSVRHLAADPGAGR